MSEKKTKRKELEEKYLKARGKSLVTSPGSAAFTLSQIVPGADRMEIRDFISEVVSNVNDGDLTAPESLLVNQAYTLNRVFHNQITKAHDSKLIEQGQFHSDMAFRAQAQCNRTLRTLLEYKNPKRATFIKQQNNLQINHANEEKEKSVKPANELLENDHESRLDTRAPQEAIRGDKTLETVERVHRPKNARR
jgi:hypothetical protein